MEEFLVASTSPDSNGSNDDFGTPSWSEMFHSASLCPRPPAADQPRDQPSAADGVLALDPLARLALYIAMAHAGLAFSLLLLYGLYRVLRGFVRPLQWAFLFSIPLRELQRALVAFRSPPLRLGLLPALLAVPAALLRSSAGTLADLRSALIHPSKPAHRSRDSSYGFSRLMRWLVSFWAFVVCYERLGPAGPALFALALSLAGPAATSVVKHASFATGRSSIPSGGRVLTGGVLKHLNTIVAVGLIVGMIIGAIVGGIFFSYKIGVEGKDAVMSLKSHVQKSNYAERIGFKKWMDDTDLPALLDQYSAKLCDTVWQQIDDLAVQYNLTDFANGFRHFLLGRSARPPSNETWTGLTRSPPHPYTVKLQALSMRAKNHEWATIYRELDSIFRELLITREDLVVKAKDLALQGIEVSKRVLLSSTSVLGGSANLMFSIGLKFVSGAEELLNFVSQLMVFSLGVVLSYHIGIWWSYGTSRWYDSHLQIYEGSMC